MAPDSPESPSKKRKNHSHVRRDPLLFASRRSRPSLQQPPDFLTESINTSRNTSYIPSPSPSPDRSPTRDGLRARPRQAIDRKALATAFDKVGPNINNENLRPNSSRSPLRLAGAEQDSVRSLGQAARRKPSKSPAKPAPAAKNPPRSMTPSPPRGRSIVAESPVNSESSPGRGYAEAYQRIVEEENLAQEDSIDDINLEDYGYSQEDMSQEPNGLRTKHRRSSESPTSSRALRKASPRISMINEPTIEEANKENRAVDHDSVSDVAPTENDTQMSADSGASQYARDMQRLNNALQGNGQAFRKARVGQKAGLTTNNLRRSSGSNESLGSSFSSGSLSRLGSDPSVNIPKAWGRKAKPGKDWLNRINSRSGRFTGDPPRRSPSGDQLIAQSEKRNSEASVYSIPAADVPLPESSSLANVSSSGSTPRTSIQRNTPLEAKSQWVLDNDEFTGRFLQISESPPLRIRNSTLDRARDRDIIILEEKAVNNDRSGRERSPSAQLLPFEVERSSASGSSPERFDNHDEVPKTTEKGRQDKHGLIKGQQGSNQDLIEATNEYNHEEVGEPIPDTPIVVFRRSDEGARRAEKVKNRRGESHDLLKRLALMSSQSPSPVKELGEASEKSEQVARGSEHESKGKPSLQPSKSETYQKTPVVTGAWVEQTPSSTPQVLKSKSSLKTPFVTGGWIETPLPTGSRGPPMPTPSDPDDSRELGANKLGASELVHKLNTSTPRPQLRILEPLKYTGPPLPKSALEEIINDARSGKLNDTRPDLESAEEPTLHLGESTIQSLEDILANDTDYSTLLATSQETSPPTSDPSSSSSNDQSKTQEENQDPQSYTQLVSRLRNLGPSIRASTRQIASLERAVSTTKPHPQTQPSDECHEAGEFHDFIWPCPRCNCPGRTSSGSLIDTTDSLTTINLTIPRLWYWKRDDWRPRLTWLGVLLFCIYACLFAENWAQYVAPLLLPYVLWCIHTN